jgi:hypothetical protein
MSIEINDFAKNMLGKIDTLFHPNVFESKYGDAFINMVRTYESQPQKNIEMSCHSMSVTLSLWGLVRIMKTQDVEAQHQYELFLQYLQNSMGFLQKAMQIEQRYQTRIVPNPTTSLLSTIIAPQQVLPPESQLPL